MVHNPLVQKARSVARSIPAPVGGWNTRDALGEMDQADAVQLMNWFPATTQVMVRNGYSQSATFTGQCETVMAYQGANTSKLFVAAGTKIYDATAGGALTVASVTSLTNVRFQYVNVATPGGNFILACNGADSVYSYNGTAWANPSITNVTSANLININLFKNRVWFIEKNTLKAWYLPVQSIAGAAAALDLSAFASRGGYLMAMATWTIDAGYGVDDLAVFITSEGECIVYRGTDPSSASTWALVGIYWLGSPIGRRCFVKYKGDMLLICQDGVVALSSALQSSRLNPKVALTDKILYTMSLAVSVYGSNFGWQLMPFPKENMLFLNVPVQEGNAQQQYVMNTITGSWCNFTNWNANCWELYNDDIYFGGNGFLAKAWDTSADNGDPITYDALQAFNYFGSRGQDKRFTMMRPTIQSNGVPATLATMNIDFDQTAPNSTISTVVASINSWDNATWDSALWQADTQYYRTWQGTTGVGYCGAPRLQGISAGISLSWIATDVVIEPGAIL